MSLINVTNLTFAYDGNYETIFENVSFQLDDAVLYRPYETLSARQDIL